MIAPELVMSEWITSVEVIPPSRGNELTWLVLVNGVIEYSGPYGIELITVINRFTFWFRRHPASSALSRS